jgi:RNase P protein component
MHLAGQREAHNAGVIDDNNDDRESAEKIETRLPLAVRKARVDDSFVCGRANARNLAARREKRILRAWERGKVARFGYDELV